MDIANIVSISISALSLALSLFITIRTFVKERESYTVDIIDYRKHCGKWLFLMICVTNKSASPLTITEIKYGDICCGFEPEKVQTGAVLTYPPQTAAFPLCIPAHGAQYAYIRFLDESLSSITLTAGTTVQLQVRTTQSTSLRSILLPQKCSYLHRT